MSLPVAEIEYREHLNEMFGQPVNPSLYLVPSGELAEPGTLNDAQRDLVEQHISLVAPGVEWVRRHYSSKIDREEATSDGYVGLCDAARRYNAALASFPTYAPWRIRGEIIDSHRRSLKLGGKNRRQPRVITHTGGNARSLDAPLSPRVSPDFTLHHVVPDTGVDVESDGIDGSLVRGFYEQLWRQAGVSDEGLTIIGLRAQGFTHRQVATELGISHNRARTAWKYLRLAIEATIQPDHFDEPAQ